MPQQPSLARLDSAHTEEYRFCAATIPDIRLVTNGHRFVGTKHVGLEVWRATNQAN